MNERISVYPLGASARQSKPYHRTMIEIAENVAIVAILQACIAGVGFLAVTTGAFVLMTRFRNDAKTQVQSAIKAGWLLLAFVLFLEFLLGVFLICGIYSVASFFGVDLDYVRLSGVTLENIPTPLLVDGWKLRDIYFAFNFFELGLFALNLANYYNNSPAVTSVMVGGFGVIAVLEFALYRATILRQVVMFSLMIPAIYVLVLSLVVMNAGIKRAYVSVIHVPWILTTIGCAGYYVMTIVGSQYVNAHGNGVNYEVLAWALPMSTFAIVIAQALALFFFADDRIPNKNNSWSGVYPNTLTEEGAADLEEGKAPKVHGLLDFGFETEKTK